MNLKNGLFGMNFLQPDYGLASSDWRQDINFRFKKSVFSFENLLVCLGSDISARRTSGPRYSDNTISRQNLGARRLLRLTELRRLLLLITITSLRPLQARVIRPLLMPNKTSTTYQVPAN